MKWVIKSTVILLLGSFAGCSSDYQAQLSPENYVRYVEASKSQLKNTIRSGIWSYAFQYKPSSYIALKEQDPHQINKNTILKREVNLEKTVWFNVAISVDGKSIDPLKYEVKDLNEYNARLNYFLKTAAENFHLTYGNKGEMKQVGYYFENNYSIKPEVIAVVGFSIPDISPHESITLEYDDELFNAGILKFNISKDVFSQIPTLSI